VAAFPQHWRSFDLTERLTKIQRTFDFAEVMSAEDVPILVNTPCYFAFATYDKPGDYFDNPASMVAYQERGYERHLAEIDDDLVPYFMPWFGTGVLASGFGCEITLQPGPGNDPAVAGPCITTPSDVAKLKLPDPHKDGWMPRVLETINYAVENSDLPVGLTDMQGPLDTVGQMCGQQQLFLWMYEEPNLVHELFDMVTEAFIEWTKVQKEHIGEPLDRSNGLQGVGASPIGIWESDDDMIMVGPKQYREFVVPYVSRIFRAFGGGSVHFCGKGFQHLDNILAIDDVRIVNTSPMAHHQAFGGFRRRLGQQVVIQLQDIAPIDVEGYYRRLFSEIDDLRGLMLATFAVDGLGMEADGGYVTVEWQPFEIAKRVVDVVRECVSKTLAGEPLL
jgi:uroporphyrinogen-III decarboxylase